MRTWYQRKVQSQPVWVDHQSLRAIEARHGQVRNRTMGSPKCPSSKTLMEPNRLTPWWIGCAIMRTLGAANKAFMKISEQPRRSTREKNVVSWFSYNDYMPYRYAFMMKVATSGEPENVSRATKDPRWTRICASTLQKWDVGSRPLFTPPESNQMSVDIQGEAQRWQHRQSVQVLTCRERVHADIGGGLWRELCPDEDDNHSNYDRACSNQRVAPPSNGCQEHLSPRQIRWGGVYSKTTQLQVEHTPASGMPTQESSLWHLKITKYLHQIGFKISKSDNSLFIWSNSPE